MTSFKHTDVQLTSQRSSTIFYFAKKAYIIIDNLSIEEGFTVHYYLTGVSKTMQYRIPPFLLADHTFPAGFP